MTERQNETITEKTAEKWLARQIPAKKLDVIWNRPERSPAQKCRENNAVSEELKKQISELAGIRKCDNVDTRLQKIETAVETLKEQSKPLRRAMNSQLFSTDTELLEMVAAACRETLLEISGSAVIDPFHVGKAVGAALNAASSAMKHYTPDTSEWCDEWILDEEEDGNEEHFNEFYGDSDTTASNRFAERFGFMHRHYRDLLIYSKPGSAVREHPEVGKNPQLLRNIGPSVFPINVENDFILQLVDVERVEKQKKIREKVEKDKKKKEVGELVKVNDKADNVQSEEVSISQELRHVLNVLKKELRTRKTDSILYFEFVTNPSSYSRTVENMFYISYLMRDREVFLVENEGVPIIKRPAKDSEEKTKLIAENSTHGVTSLSFEQWTQLSKVIKQAIIEPLE